MRADEILKQATLNGVTVSVGATGKLKAAGTKEAINRV